MSSTAWQSQDVSSDIQFLERYSEELGPVQAHNTAARLHAQADTLNASLKDIRHSVQRLQSTLSEKVKELGDQKKYAKRIAGTIADDRLVLERKEQLKTMPTGDILLKAATNELAVLRKELTNTNNLITNTTKEIAMTRKSIAVQAASASELSTQLKALLQLVRRADIAACEQASAFASTKVLLVKRWYDEATANSNKALQKLQAMVLKCADGKCTLLSGESVVEDDGAPAIEPNSPNYTYTTTEETSTSAPLRSSLLAKLQDVLSQSTGLLDMLSTAQTKLREFEDALDVARKALNSVKEAERESIAQAQSMRFQYAPVNDTDSRIATLARDVVRKELVVRRLLAKIALERAAFNAVKNVAKTRALLQQKLQMRQLELKSQDSVERHCARLRNDTAITTDTPQAALPTNEVVPAAAANTPAAQPQKSTETPAEDEMF